MIAWPEVVSWVAVAICFVVAVGAVGYACFVRGYNLGWDERHKDMVLPRNVVERHNEQERRSAKQDLLAE